jgi:hypothetical protein
MRRVAALVMAGVLMAGCGRSSELPEPLAAELQARTTTIRAAAGAGDRAGAEAALAELRRRVVELDQAGQVGHGKAAEILAAAAAVESRLAALPAPAPPPPPPTTAPPQQPYEYKEDRGKEDKGKGEKDDD